MDKFLSVGAFLATLVVNPASIQAERFTSDVCYIIKEYSSIYDIPASIIDGLIQVESSFRVKVVGDDGKSIGLMQVQYATAKGMGFKGSAPHLIFSKLNIEYGTRYLRYLVDRYNDLNQALLAYNRGMVYVDNGGNNMTYVNKVLTASKTPRCEYGN